MREAQWTILLISALLFAALLWFSLAARPGSRGSRAARRAFWAAALLLIMGALGAPGLTMLNWALCAALGLPGYGAVLALG